MKILFEHANSFEYNEEKSCNNYNYKNCLIARTCIEEGDEYNLKEIIQNIKEVVKIIKPKLLILFPFAHLSRNLMEKQKAEEFFLQIKSKMDNIDCILLPFGISKGYKINIKDHKFNNIFRSIEINSLNKKQKILIKKGLEENKPRIMVVNLPDLDIDNFKIVGGVLNPTKSWVSYDLSKFLKNNNFLYKNKKILDMGCGSGIQGIVCVLNGAKKVTSIDISPGAIDCTKINVEQFNLSDKINVIKSNLFKNINKKEKFDIIIFNHPLFNIRPKNDFQRIIFSDENILNKFFEGLKDHINKNTLLIMPYSHFVGLEKQNDPLLLIKKYNFKYKRYLIENKFGKHSIYIIEVGK